MISDLTPHLDFDVRRILVFGVEGRVGFLNLDGGLAMTNGGVMLNFGYRFHPQLKSLHSLSRCHHMAKPGQVKCNRPADRFLPGGVYRMSYIFT